MSKINSTEPYISFVFTGRNDNYGGDFRMRLQLCVSSLSEQLNRFEIYSEIIFVNYNPLPSPDIVDFIEWPHTSKYVTIRIITVPNQVHQNFVAEKTVKDVPVNEYLGKNAGIRRSKGEFILSMNPDILFPDELIRFLSREINSNAYYRANRIDFNFIEGKKQLLRINLKGHTQNIHRYSRVHLKWFNLKYGIINSYMVHTVRMEKLLNRLKKPVFYDNAELRFHCKTSGDFMLMHRSHWETSKSYFESAPIALHIDSLFTIQAAMKGLNEKIISFPIYHQEHERRYSADNNNPEELAAYQYFQKEAQDMLKQKKNKIYNDDNWGLADLQLPEIIF